MSDQTEAERIRREQREFWNSSAPGWKRMSAMLDRAAQHVSDRLGELARIGTGQGVLDVASGAGEPGLTAAREGGPHGLAVTSGQSPALLEPAGERAPAREPAHD